jgi:hypothetical protein
VLVNELKALGLNVELLDSNDKPVVARKPDEGNGGRNRS